MAVSEKSLKNLEKGSCFTTENAREYGMRGKIRSDEAKKKRKDMARMLSIIAEGDITDEEVKEKLSAVGFEDEDMQNEALVANALYEKCKKGDVRAIEKWVELRNVDSSTPGPRSIPC